MSHAVALSMAGWPVGGLRLLAAALAREAWGSTLEDPPAAVPGVSIGSIQRQDPRAWHVLFAEEMPAVYRYVRSRIPSEHDAEDLTSQVFEEAWRRASALEDRGLPVRAWLFGIARNIVSSHRRRWVLRPPVLSLDAVDGAIGDGGHDPELIDLASAISSLSAAHSEVITLRFLHGLSLEETAAVLDTTVDGVKGRQARAVAQLRELLVGKREWTSA
jgi:RNA polymerase sigma-70 factor (ECF subfamily)